jgi:diguanylate cyclase (GGDEF)-like protein
VDIGPGDARRGGQLVRAVDGAPERVVLRRGVPYLWMMSAVDADQDQDGLTGDGAASLLRARLSAILDTTLDPLLLARPVRDDSGVVVDFVIADMNGSHSRAGGDRSTMAGMHLPQRSPELFAMYRRVLEAGTTESERRVWVKAHPEDMTSSPGWADVRATGVAGDVVVSWRNVDADVAAEDLLRIQAMQDPLTGLPNRRGLMEMLSALCAGRDPFSVAFVDIDQFKSINDQHGHGVGDAVLVATGERLRSVLREDDVVARLAGDEFVVIARHLHDPTELHAMAQRLLSAGADGNHVVAESAGLIHVSVSVGALYVAATGRRREAADVLRAADALMYSAKAQGGGQLALGELPDETTASLTPDVGAELNCGRR